MFLSVLFHSKLIKKYYIPCYCSRRNLSWGRSCGGLRTCLQAWAQAKPTTKWPLTLFEIQVRVGPCLPSPPCTGTQTEVLRSNINTCNSAYCIQMQLIIIHVFLLPIWYQRVEYLPDPERKLVPSASLSAVPSLSASPSMGELKAAQPSPHLSPLQSTQQLSHTAHKPKWVSEWNKVIKIPLQFIYLHLWTFHVYTLQPEEDAPPRPPLPHLYSPDEHPPAVPPLPKETSVIRHTSVRGLKRQSDERKRDREIGQYPNGDQKVCAIQWYSKFSSEYMVKCQYSSEFYFPGTLGWDTSIPEWAWTGGSWWLEPG